MDNETIALNHPEMSDQDLEEVFACKALAVNPNAILQNVRGFEMFTFAVNGKFLADPKDVRGSGSRSVSAPGMQQTATSQITGSNGTPIFKDAKSLKQYVASEMGKTNLKY